MNREQQHWIDRERPLLTLVLLVLAVTSWVMVWWVWPAGAHGSADWINRGGYKNKAGDLCCGERDCFELSLSDVKVITSGYLIIRTGDVVPFNESTPSPTGTYWLCIWGGKRKCFFYPPSFT